MICKIVLVQVGQCINLIGNVFWNALNVEHKLAKDGKLNQLRLDKIDVYFKKAGELRYRFESELGCLDAMKASPIGTVVKPDNFVFGASDGNNWTKGHYSECARIIDRVVDVIRKEAESCDMPQGFEITHSLGGGIRSGLAPLLPIIHIELQQHLMYTHHQWYQLLL